ncbi:unnamed protein product [Peronospora belbahrii]|uniref:COMM domain-containing protein n=1 Tax=Peronospora belbahrii TaxID=622444 RepID=A0ABN8D9X5_9STRA|nr:unnamed protein product [Peronospora belbahrii]
MKFRFCGGLEPPDWLLVELPLLSETDRMTTDNLVAMCQAIGADITAQALDQTHLLSQEVDDRKVKKFKKTAAASLRFILTHAAKYNTAGRDLMEELQQLGMHQSTAEAIAQSYEDIRPRIQDQQRAQRFRFPNVKTVEWKVEASSNVLLKMKLDQEVLECDMAITSATSDTRHVLNFDMSPIKFVALYEDLSQAQSILRAT